MKFIYEVTFDIDPNVLTAKGPRYVEAACESIREFSVEMREWIERHPLVDGVKLTESE